MPYQPPSGHKVALTFVNGYEVPAGYKVGLEFSPSDGPVGDTQYLFPGGVSAALYGETYIWRATEFVSVVGLAAPATSNQHKAELYTRYIGAISIADPAVSKPHVRNWNYQAFPNGFVNTYYGRPLVWNLRQYIYGQSFNSELYGKPYLQGGVKYITPSGLLALAFGRPSLVNTTANQYAKPAGIPIVPLPSPAVSPRSLRPFGILGASFGSPRVEFPPRAKGWLSSAFGYPVIEDKTKYVAVDGVSSDDQYGYPVVFDPTIKILVSSVIQSGVFGDTAVKNNRFVLNAEGIDSASVSPWAALRNTRRLTYASGWHSLEFGESSVANKTPSIAPAGFDALRLPNAAEIGIGYAVRLIYTSGINRGGIGVATLTKTPEIAPKGIAAPTLGLTTVWHRVRTLEVQGADAYKSGSANVWFRYRFLTLQDRGWKSSAYGLTKLEHEHRTTTALGADSLIAGIPYIGLRNRTIAPMSAWGNFAAWHMVGGSRFLGPAGFVATAFGARIIPPQTQVYVLGFAGAFGLAAFRNARRLLSPSSITVGQQAADAWGTARAFNLRQHVSMSYDVDSGLNPPAWPQWTSIVNRTKSLGITGSLMSRVAEPSIDNKARPLHPAGVAAPILPPEYRSGMVAYRVRSCRIEGLEAPYMSTWLSVLNDGRVLAPKGYVASSFGVAGLVNTRRYYSRVGAFDSAWFGYPMVADRIRTITADPRYSIAPPIIRLPEVKQYTRYIDGAGYESAKVGGHSLTVRFNRITPRWTLQNLYGSPIVKNLTPELGQRGRAADEYGDAHIRLQWRPVAPYDSLTQAIGKPGIAYRDRTVFGQGLNAMSIGNKLVVTKTGAPPYSTQWISLEKFAINGSPSELGDGINTPGFPLSQLGLPIINQQVVYHHQQDVATLFGSPRLTANTVRVEPGYGELLVGDPMVSLKRRALIVGAWPDDLVYQPSKARVSPHTIYATVEAGKQAKDNHPTFLGLHYVDGYYRAPGVTFGSLTITLQHRTIRAYPATPPQIPGVTVANKRHYILAAGIRSLRFGWHTVPGPQAVVQFDSVSHAVVGVPTVARPPYIGPITLPLNGLNAHGPSLPRIELLNRQLRPVGYDALLPGSIFYGDGPYQWRGLRVGPLVPTMPKGASMQAMGAPWISFRVRNLGLAGFDSFISEYDLMNFAKRMRVIRQPLPRPSLSVMPAGFVAFESAASDVRHGAHYIRPDGNADQYRKGAF